MKLTAIARRLDAIEHRVPPTPEPPRYDVARLTDSEVEALAGFNERILNAGAPEDEAELVALFSPEEREAIGGLLRRMAVTV